MLSELRASQKSFATLIIAASEDFFATVSQKMISQSRFGGGFANSRMIWDN